MKKSQGGLFGLITSLALFDWQTKLKSDNFRVKLVFWGTRDRGGFFLLVNTRLEAKGGKLKIEVWI